MTGQTEARRLIESAFEQTVGSAENLPRALEAVATFRAAADAYARGNTHETALLLSLGIDGSSEPAMTAHDVAAAGVASVAKLLVGLPCACGDESCPGPDIEVRGGGEDVDPIHRAAEAFVDVAMAGMLGLLTQMLNRFYEESTLDELCTLVMTLVSMWAKAAQLSAIAARYDS